MIDILEFVFSDVLHFLGTVVLLETIFGGLRKNSAPEWITVKLDRSKPDK